MGLEVLLIGATGHIGGAVLVALTRAYPDLNITALVRATNDLSGLPARVRTVPGSLEDSSKIRQLALQATIVINCAPDITHGLEIRSILQGLAESKSAPHRYYIHTTGAALIWDSMTGKVDGSRVWDDVADIDLITNLEDSRTHARTDRIVRDANSDTVHTALVSPVFVLGVNPGGKRPTPLIWPNLLHVMRALGCGFTVQSGSNITSFVEINALARLYAALVGNALSRLGSPLAGPTWVGKGKSTEAGIPVWGPQAYYFASSVAVPWRELMRDRILPALRRHGATFLRSDEVRELPGDSVRDIIMSRYEATAEVELWAKHIAEGFGVNMRVRCSRAEKALGISLHDEDAGLEETIRALMAEEPRR